MAIQLKIFIWLFAFFSAAMSFAEETMSLIKPDSAFEVDNLANYQDLEDTFIGNNFVSLVQLFVVLALVIALAYLVLNKGVGYFVRKTYADKTIQVKERVALDQKRCLYLIEVKNERFLLGGTDNNITLLSQLNSFDEAASKQSFSTSLNQGVQHLYGKTSLSKDSKIQAES